ncbi:MAG: ASKHA domain-containing protein [Actinobacteria bacterium]|nr:ASKHA domain-containing protein [Actinomycetota bacterium]
MSYRKKLTVKFFPGEKIIEVPKDYNLKQAILESGLDIESTCGGVGTCGRCKVQVKSGHVYAKGNKFISDDEKKKGFVLSCQSKIKENIVVLIPEKTKAKGKIEKGKFEIGKGKLYSGINTDELAAAEIKPWIIKEKITVEKPTLDSNTNDLYRLEKSIRNNFKLENISFPISVIRKLPYTLRDNNWEIVIILDKITNTLVNIQSVNKEKKIFGFAIDIGTTTLVIYLVDLTTGEVIGTASEYNPQIKFGEDIISRIVYTLKNDGLKRLRDVLLDLINKMVLALLKSSNIDEEDVVSMMVAGNSTMMHIFYGVPPRFIREVPYVTVTNKFPGTSAPELDLKYIKNAAVYSIEGVASYLGGDISSGVLATNMAKRKEITLFLDLGTNGELVVGNCDWMVGCSCSAGPAFEGGGVKCGIRAVDGAIEKVVIDQNTYKCFFKTIGQGKPVGICGSGLIDLISEMFLRGVIDRRGKFEKGIKNPFLKYTEDEYIYVVAEAGESGTGKDIFISEVDIDNLMRAKAAVYAGIKTLLEEVDLNIKDIDKVYIAGGLGKNINVQSAIIIGMLPDINIKKYYFLGNTSVTGAYLCLLSEHKYKLAEEIANNITYIELSVNMKFMDRYVAGLFLPYTDLKDFPNVESLFYSY